MEFDTVINERHSTRAFLNKPISRETIENLLSLATKGPSAINLQNCSIDRAAGLHKVSWQSATVQPRNLLSQTENEMDATALCRGDSRLWLQIGGIVNSEMPRSH